MKWELIKYKIRCVCIEFSKNIAKEKRRNFETLQQNIKQFENFPSTESNSLEIYSAEKLEFEALMDEKTKGYILRSKTDWYEYGDKSSQLFLNLEKKKLFKIQFKF